MDGMKREKTEWAVIFESDFESMGRRPEASNAFQDADTDFLRFEPASPPVARDHVAMPRATGGRCLGSKDI